MIGNIFGSLEVLGGYTGPTIILSAIKQSPKIENFEHPLLSNLDGGLKFWFKNNEVNDEGFGCCQLYDYKIWTDILPSPHQKHILILFSGI